MPQAAVIEYLVEAAPAQQTETPTGKVRVFCIDVSGSMCVTSEVAGKVDIKGGDQREKEARALCADEGISFERLTRANVTHVSRLQCVQAAVAREIEREAREVSFGFGWLVGWVRGLVGSWEGRAWC